MSVGFAVIVILVSLCVTIDVLAVFGLFAMRTTMQRLHFVGPMTCVAPVLAGIAILMGTHATPSQGAKGLLIALVLATFGGMLSHETARAAIAREGCAD
jgi:hypothetical protein